jgi:hypothetical protein
MIPAPAEVGGSTSSAAAHNYPMGLKPPRGVLSRVRKLAQIARELSKGANFSITRLTTLKSLCEDPEVTAHFAVDLAKHTSRSANKRSNSGHLGKDGPHDELITRSVERLASYVERPSDPEREALQGILRELEKANTSPLSTTTRRSTVSLRRKLICSTTSGYLRRRCIK